METPKRITEAAKKYKERRAAIKQQVHAIASEVRQNRQERAAKLGRTRL